MAKVRHLPAFDGPVFVDIGQHHLFLLDGIEPGLADVGDLLTRTPIDLCAEGVLRHFLKAAFNSSRSFA